MIKTDLLELIRNGEDSKLEFKRDTVRRESLAKVLVSFLNLDGGTVLLGVEDDRTISGVARDRPDEWIADICRRMIDPKIVPILSWTRDVEPGRDILAVSVTPGPNKPYACIRGEGKAYFIRVASTSREASQEELERMFQASGRINYGKKPVPGTTLDSLDMRRLRIYFSDVLGGCAPEETDRSEWELLLRNQELMRNSGDHCVATVDGLLLFGIAPRRGLPQSGVRAVCYASNQPELAARADEALFGPMVPLARSAGDQIQERGLIEQALDFVRRNTNRHARLDGARRVDTWDYPEEVVREALLNALVHRDYSIAGADVMLAIYSDRMEVQSPGKLPNTLTVESMKAGVRYTRNHNLVNVMRDYGYVEARGMGVRNKIIPLMREHNGTEPDLIEEHHRFRVVLWKSNDAR